NRAVALPSPRLRTTPTMNYSRVRSLLKWGSGAIVRSGKSRRSMSAMGYRWEEGHFERAAEIFADLVGRNVDVIVTHATTNVIAAKKAASVIPIVFAVASDPVGTGLIASLARPAGNVTRLARLPHLPLARRISEPVACFSSHRRRVLQVCASFLFVRCPRPDQFRCRNA